MRIEVGTTMGLENPIHLMLVLLVALLVFGAKRLPEMGRSMGEGMRSFKQAISAETAPAAATVTAIAPAPTGEETHA
jgi:sec-independent protein translocase protein TatA